MAVIAVLALGMSAIGIGAARAQDCALKQYDSLPMEVYPDVAGKENMMYLTSAGAK
jgi:hypothetical protein